MTPGIERLVDSGRQAETAGNVREALVRFEAAVKLAGDDAVPRLRLGTLCHRTRDYSRAREVLDEATRLDPDNAEVAFRLGLTCDALGDGEAARAAFRRAMMLAPSGWEPWFLIGRDHRELGHAEVARLAYHRALDAAPDAPELLFELGTLLWEMGMRDDAFALLERAVRTCPVDPGYTLQPGPAEMERDNLTAARWLLTTAKHLAPAERRIELAFQDLASRTNPPRRRARPAQRAEVKGELGEVDVLAGWVARRFGGLVEGVEIRTGLHFDDGKALPVIEIEIPAVLKERATNRDRALVVQGRAVDEERRDAVETEAVVQPVGIFRVFFVDDVGDHDVADAAVESGRLAEHVDAAQRPGALRDLPQHVVGTQSEWIVDVDQHGRAALQPIRWRTPQPRIEVGRGQPVENDHLRGDVETGLARKEKDATLLFFSGTKRTALTRLGRLPVIGARRVIEEVIPVAARLRSEEHTSELQSRGHLVCRL